jgi:hypothetical protein
LEDESQRAVVTKALGHDNIAAGGDIAAGDTPSEVPADEHVVVLVAVLGLLPTERLLLSRVEHPQAVDQTALQEPVEELSGVRRPVDLVVERDRFSSPPTTYGRSANSGPSASNARSMFGRTVGRIEAWTLTATNEPTAGESTSAAMSHPR